MLEYSKGYAKTLNANEEVLNWVQLVIGSRQKKKKPTKQDDVEHILDYLLSSAAPSRLSKMSYEQAKISADKWSKSNQKKGKNLEDSNEDIETIHTYSDGSKIVKLLTQNAYKREGFLMSHCVGGYSVNSNIQIYSYRDAKNMPHATFEVQKLGNQVSQIKGKGNGAIHPKYITPILDFLKAIGQQIRPSEMKNLGYYHINKDTLSMIQKIKGFETQTVVLYGETYAF
jgi:PcfJ-like protein